MSKLSRIFETITDVARFCAAQTLPCSKRLVMLDAYADTRFDIKQGTGTSYYLTTLPRLNGTHDLNLTLIGNGFEDPTTQVMSMGFDTQYMYTSLPLGNYSKEQTLNFIQNFNEGKPLSEMGLPLTHPLIQHLTAADAAKELRTPTSQNTSFSANILNPS